MPRRSKDRVPDLGGFEDLLSEDACLDDDRMLDGLTTKQLGNVGEAIAALYLKERGYDSLERNYRCHEGEADLIALDTVEGVIVLVEVKTRRVRHLDDDEYPEEAVNDKKRRRYRRIAANYLMDRFPVPAIRFDVVAVSVASGHLAGIRHMVGAFDWEAEP